jgi:hypothetical protein
LIVNTLKGIFRAMAEPKFKVRPRKMTAALRDDSLRRGPTMAALRAQAKDAMREDEGIDFGPLSHDERNKILLGR